MSASLSLARQFERFRKLVHERTGIFLPASKSGMIESRLRPRVLALGVADVAGYFEAIFDKGGLPDELPHIIEAITTNKTDFFREPDHYAFLSNEFIPSVLRRHQGRRALLKLWSAAASTGAEAWSAAMLLADAKARAPELEWGILGTDISRQVIQVARRAIYPEAEIQPVPADLRNRYTMKGHGRGGAPLRRIVPELRRRVNFHEMNLIDRSYPVDRDIHVIFLRNVLIYFDATTQARIVTNLCGHLRLGGCLIVGHSESMIVREACLTQRAPGVFERTSERLMRPGDAAGPASDRGSRERAA